jgi:hypothetical protein
MVVSLVLIIELVLNRINLKTKLKTFLSELTTHLGPTNTNSAMHVIIQVNSLEPHCVKNFNKMPKNMASKQAPKIIQNPHERRQ